MPAGFYINLPLGTVTFVILLFFFNPKNKSTTSLPLGQKLARLDLPGLIMFIPAVIMLLLAVQRGGNTHAWRSATIIGLIIGFAILMGIFAYWQYRIGDDASIPFRIVGQRSVYSSVAMLFFGLGAVQMMGYYIPMWFQVIHGASPVHSGIRFLPTVGGNLVASVVTGGLGKCLLAYAPFLM